MRVTMLSQDHGQIQAPVADRPQDVDPGAVGERDVADDEIEAVVRQQVPRRLQVRRQLDRVPGLP